MPHPDDPTPRKQDEFLTRLAAAGRNGATLASLYDGPPPVWAAAVAQNLVSAGLVERSRAGVYTVTPAGEGRLARAGPVKISTDFDNLRRRAHNGVSASRDTSGGG